MTPAHPPDAEARDPGLAGFEQAVAAARPERARVPGALIGPDGRVDPTAVGLSVFRNLLASDGIRAALYALLRRSDYRYIGIFRFRDGLATSVVHVDRQNLGDLQAAEVSETATYCTRVRDAAQPFVTADAPTDARVVDHPARDVVRAYCGVPVVGADGAFIGTLCHYDLVPRDPRPLDLDLILKAARELGLSGLVPPYPDRPR